MNISSRDRRLFPYTTNGRVLVWLSAACLLWGVGAGCATKPPSNERAACLNYQSSSEVNDSSSIVLILVGVTNAEAFRAATPRQLLSESPPGTEGKSRTIVVTPGESGSERVMIERLASRLGVIADYRNRTSTSKIAVDLPIRCHWPRPGIELMKDTLDD